MGQFAIVVEVCASASPYLHDVACKWFQQGASQRAQATALCSGCCQVVDCSKDPVVFHIPIITAWRPFRLAGSGVSTVQRDSLYTGM